MTEETLEDGAIAVLLPAREIPLGSEVTRRTGEKRVTIIDKIRIFDESGTAREIKAEGDTRFLSSSRGDFNVVPGGVLLLWRTTGHELLDFLRDLHEGTD